MRKFSLVLTGVALFLLIGTAARADNFVITYGAPGAQSASSVVIANANVLGVENFNSLPTNCNGFTTDYGTSGAITGTYSSGACVDAANQYGGAGGTGNFVTTHDDPGYTITLSTKSGIPGVNYFGYWLSALDPGNFLEFLDDGTVVGTFTPSDLIAALGACPEAYCGNPNTAFKGDNAGQQYAFVNFVDTTGYFNEIEVNEVDEPGAGYESDNHTVAYCSNAQACISGKVVSTTPEPGSVSLALLGIGLLGLAGFLVRR
jgi:hypothetical protein